MTGGPLKLSLAVLTAGACLTVAACGGASSTGASTVTPSGASAGSSAGVPAVPGLSQQAIDIMNSPAYRNSTWAVSVVDTATGEKLIDYNSQTFLEPASVTKTYSVGAGWLQFGPDAKIITPVVHTGSVAGGTLTGDLVLVAKGDILMGGQTGADGKVVFTNLDHNDANALPGATIATNNPLAGLDQLAAQVKAAGITTVSGRVEIDDRLFATADLGNDGPVSPIVINNNLIDIVTSPTAPGQPAKIDQVRPQVAPWQVDNRVQTVDPGGRAKIEVTSPSAGVVQLTGTIPSDSAPVLNVYTMPDPATFARTAFIEALGRAGVAVAAPAVQANSTAGLPSDTDVAGLPQVATLQGLDYQQNATYILKISYNRGAQTQVCLIAVAAGSKDCDDGFPKMADLFKSAGIDPRNASLLDGSGLTGNYITASSQTQLESVFAARPDGSRWRSALPIMGVDGSIATVQKDSPAAGQVSAKTGTLADGDLLNNRLRVAVKSLGGYMTAKSGREISVAIIMNQAMFDDIQGVFKANEDLGAVATQIWQSY
ncbi:MAG: D-alanyl-D-alanine carboxypeptidase/D-alanyl-D-alanine-endopeptidase [Candidatus Nanopelagicales bacterium]